MLQLDFFQRLAPLPQKDRFNFGRSSTRFFELEVA